MQEQAQRPSKSTLGNSFKKYAPSTKPKPKKLKPLADRWTRIRLLLSSYPDAATASTTADTKIKGTKTHQSPSRNRQLWDRGSYDELEKVLERLRQHSAYLYYAFYTVFVYDAHHRISRNYSRATLTNTLEAAKLIRKWMPEEIYVPYDVSRNAGYLASDAKMYATNREQKEVSDESYLEETTQKVD